ncbi:MAG: hypothetical protein U0797_27355 [Gemmataceae bacterium]
MTRSSINFHAGAATVRGVGPVLRRRRRHHRAAVRPAGPAHPAGGRWPASSFGPLRIVDRRALPLLLKATRFDAGLALATAASAVLLSVEFSILIGVFLSFLFFVPRASRLAAPPNWSPPRTASSADAGRTTRRAASW